MYIECNEIILFQIDIENNIKFSSPKIKIKKEYSCLISMRTLVHALAHRSHSVSKFNLSFVGLAQCSLRTLRTGLETNIPACAAKGICGLPI